ncbi:hypothetical protein GLW08_05485 [Pontibacillus yanchengensis]|uniref:Uncharacterized protein n=2 Tax=Pontibacillus yanchengensis TaxID=462910 RepID=A0ACC7VDC2_9BACI|nr:hypothetical protein [Pontibacillus yanchengensis]MYL32207.1 hypothetical protein [Pontibacillus yanchengensis]MYL52787.1 hypothetical protein [Pontibacillus yanchengensis]
MSEKRRVIKVDEVLIQADNVVIEPRRDRHDDRKDDRRDGRNPFDSLFGPRRMEVEEAETEEKEEVTEENEGEQRPPFSWI